MATIRQRIETSHRDIVHDAQLNMYGNRLATGGTDRLVKIYEVRPNGQSYPVAELKGHTHIIWKVSWSHPRFGYLASASYDKKVIIWQEIGGKWQKSYEWALHSASVNSVAFAQSKNTLVLASCSADGDIGILKFDPSTAQWKSTKIQIAHEQGVNSVQWAPESPADGEPKRLVSCGNDKNVKIWIKRDSGEWECEKVLHGHTDYVRDVVWCPVVSNGTHQIVSCGLDGNLVIYKTKAIESGEWTVKLLEKLPGALFSLSWSPCGTFFSLAGDDNHISIWQENLQGQWSKNERENKEKEGFIASEA